MVLLQRFEHLLVNKLHLIGYRERAPGAVLYVTSGRCREAAAGQDCQSLGRTSPLTLLGRADESLRHRQFLRCERILFAELWTSRDRDG